MSFNLYPYTDFHELNLDWIIRKIKELGQAFNDFEAVNKITNAGAWDITKQYQAWTIVSDNNIGYISLKPVPVGVAITNTEYWGLVADYDILITDLSARISALETDNTYLMNEIVKKSNKVHKILIIGDSYLDRANSYGDYLAAILTDATIVLRGESGAGFTNYSTLQGHTFEDMLNIYISGLSDADKESFTDIIAIGGSNDRGHASATVSAAIATFFNIAKANFTNARFHLGFLGWTGYSNTYQSADKLLFLDALKVYESAAYSNDLYWIENLNYNMHDYSHYADEGHPDQVASERIGDFLSRYLKTGHADVSIESSATFSINSNVFSLGTFDNPLSKVVGDIKNGITTIRVCGAKPDFANYGKIAYTTTNGLPSSNTGGTVTLATLSGGAAFGIESANNATPVVVPIPVTVVKNGTRVNVQMSAYILHGGIGLFYYNDVLPDWTQISHIIIPPFEITIPTEYA